jgi:hypothetical protein
MLLARRLERALQIEAPERAGDHSKGLTLPGASNPKQPLSIKGSAARVSDNILKSSPWDPARIS